MPLKTKVFGLPISVPLPSEDKNGYLGFIQTLLEIFILLTIAGLLTKPTSFIYMQAHMGWLMTLILGLYVGVLAYFIITTSKEDITASNCVFIGPFALPRVAFIIILSIIGSHDRRQFSVS